MSFCEQRLTENQQLFRGANERLQEAIDGQLTDGVSVPFLCECADPECRGRIEMTTHDYAAVHIQRDLYVILPGHPMTLRETIVETDPTGFLVAQKP